MAPAPSSHQLLRSLLKEANYDAALALVTRVGPENLLEEQAMAMLAPLDHLRFRRSISDVLDYGGDYKTARFVLRYGCRHIGHVARDALQQVRTIDDLRVADHAFAKQQCWALMMWGLTYYRCFDLDSAKQLFELARKVAHILHTSSPIRSIGTLARAWYCIGLVHRENRDAAKARSAFREALRLTSEGIEDRRTKNESIASFEFHMARCAGLGMGWIAYNEAKLKEADAMLILARDRMRPAKAKLIGAYLDTLQASIMMSESAEKSVVEDALRILTNAYSTFAPKGSYQHDHYAIRCQNEIALAHLRLARACQPGSPEREHHLSAAEIAIAAVQSTARKHPNTAQRSACRSFVTEARIKRERDRFDEALTVARRAKDTAGNSKLLLVDANIGIGEAEYVKGAYGRAVSAFLDALGDCKDDHKDAAACHLHLAQAYIKNNQLSDANHHFDLWRSMATDLDNAFLKALAEKVNTALSMTFQPFQLTREDIIRDGNGRRNLNKLRRWLATTALGLTDGSEREAAALLGRDINTLRLWLRL
jgi:tetratricopeptide (TPR) repeat protein